jgi:hypothetical protein
MAERLLVLAAPRASKLRLGDWRAYHHAFWVTTAYSIPDIAVILTSGVYRLGLSERHCRLDLLLANAWVRNSPAAAALKSLASSARAHSLPRHAYVHRGIVPDTNLQDLDFVCVMDSLDDLRGPIVELIAEAGWRKVYRASARDLASTLRGSRNRIQAAAGVVLDALLQVYRRSLTALPSATERIEDLKRALRSDSN